MAGIYHQVGVNVDITSVYQAITSQEGLSNWWTKTTGDTSVGSKLNFHFNEQIIEMTILELITDKKIVWQCTEKKVNGKIPSSHLTLKLQMNRSLLISHIQTGPNSLTYARIAALNGQCLC